MKIPDANGIVIDGFPRDVGQALSFDDQVSLNRMNLFSYFVHMMGSTVIMTLNVERRSKSSSTDIVVYAQAKTVYSVD